MIDPERVLGWVSARRRMARLERAAVAARMQADIVAAQAELQRSRWQMEEKIQDDELRGIVGPLFTSTVEEARVQADAAQAAADTARQELIDKHSDPWVLPWSSWGSSRCSRHG